MSLTILWVSGCYSPNSEPRETPATRSLSGSGTVTGKPPAPRFENVEQQGRQIVFTWLRRSGIDHYNLWESPDSNSGFEKVAGDLDTFTYSVDIVSRPQGWSRS
ncbi:MAG TPA: hypothetical protein ENJ43_00920, partial [Gammaproteobacteria bacterium]|nr:hypothetical protein [Gammaproteobacteria bacterium]